MIRTVLVDDHASYRHTLAFLLDRDDGLSVVGHAATVAEARSIVAANPVDVALVDEEVSDGRGLDLLPALRSHNPDAVAIVLTASTRPESPALAVADGAIGFLPKSETVAAIGNSIRRAATGEILFTTADVVDLMRQAMQVRAETQAAQWALGQLTRREREVLVGLAAGLDNQAIADQLHLTTVTTRTHIGHILRKLHVDSRLQAALLAVRHGVVDLDEISLATGDILKRRAPQVGYPMPRPPGTAGPRSSGE